MRYQAAEKLEIIRLVERSHLSVRWTLDQIGIPCATFYRWYDLYRTGGPEALEDRPSHPGRVWNRISDEIRDRIVRLALEEPELSPRELAVRFTSAITRASTTSHLPMSTSGGARPFCCKGRRSNDRPSNTGACSTA